MHVMQLVVHDYVLAVLKSPPRTRPLNDYNIDAIRRSTGITDEGALETLAASGRALQCIRDIHNDIMKQYLDKGYAYIELPHDAPKYPLPADRELLRPLP